MDREVSETSAKTAASVLINCECPRHQHEKDMWLFVARCVESIVG